MQSTTTIVGAFQTDGGSMQITIRTCEITDDIVISFGKSFMFRVSRREFERFKLMLNTQE